MRPTFSQSHRFPPSENTQPGKTYSLLSLHTYISSLTAVKHASSAQPPPPLLFPTPSHEFLTTMHVNILISAGLRGWIISTGATFDGERWISSCTHSLCLLESFRPIRSHWWGLEWHHKWVDNADHVQITTLSLSQTLRPATRPFCVEGISWI